jgi:GT2 family glycosyltransferase
MSLFAPFAIHHLQLPEAALFTPPRQNAYLVFWWQNVPLGNLWIEGKTLGLSPAEFRTEVANAVAPALHYYLPQSGSDSDWQASFSNGHAEPLLQLLQTAPLLQTFSNPHAISQRISVVICTRNRTPALKNCIEALLASSDTDFELVIVDNAPDDNSTEELVKSFPQVRYVRENRKGLDIARNAGARAASCSIVAYTDDDVLIEKNWIKNIKGCFTDPKTMCVTGQVIPAALQTEWQYIFERYWGFNKGYVPRVFDDAYFAMHLPTCVPVWEIGAGANMAFRKEVFERVGYFDERLDVGASGCSGDSEFWYRILAEGWHCRYFPHVYVYHQHRESKEALYSQIFYYMRGHVSALLVQYERYGHKGNLKRAYRLLPGWYYNRFKRRLLQGRTPHSDTILTEIRGCISGWRFYQAHKGTRPKPSRDEQVVQPSVH